MISLKPIRESASPPAYTRGNQIFKQGKILDFQVEEEGGLLVAKARVTGSLRANYQVELIYDQIEEGFLEYSCECEAFATYSGMCKHCVGTALQLLAYEQDRKGKNGQLAPAGIKGNEGKISAPRSGTAPKPNRIPPTDKAMADWISAQSMKARTRYFQSDMLEKVELQPILEEYTEQVWRVSFKIGSGQMYVLKSISALVEAVKKQSLVEYGKKLKFYHQRAAFTPHAQKILQLLEEWVGQGQAVMQQYNSQRNRHYYGGYYSSYYVSEMKIDRYLLLSGDKMIRFAQSFIGDTCLLDTGNGTQPVSFIEKDPRINIRIKEIDGGACQLSIPPVEAFPGTKQMCIYAAGTMYLCSEKYSEDMEEAAKFFIGRKQELRIHPDDLHSFCAVVLPMLESHTGIKKPEVLSQYEPRTCLLRFYLDRQNEEITAILYAEYGDEQVNLLVSEPEFGTIQAYRDMEKESAAVAAVRKYFPEEDRKRGMFVLGEGDDGKVYDLVNEGVSVLQQLGEVYVSDALKRLQIYRAPKISVGVSLNAGILDITLQSDRFSPGELVDILTEYRKKKKFYRLKNGGFLTMEDNAFAAVAEMAAGFDLSEKEIAKGVLRAPEYRAFYLDQVLREQGGDIQIKRNQQYKALLRDFKNVEDSDFEVPETLNTQLRPYQQFGYRWMRTLDTLGLGGILADDMGLGKTVQAIAFLLAGKEERREVCQTKGSKDGAEVYKARGNQRYALIICPASLVYNWENEIHRFAPGLTATPVVGTAAVRKRLIKEDKADILLVSYDLLKRDVELYQETKFQYMIIDEAQNIKNHTTQAAKAVKAISCLRRFALTGTPIENSLSELWSIFDFLMPGILNTYKKFKENYEQPIVGLKDEQTTVRLQRMIRPFILRRLKKDVLRELPDKLEEVVFSQMEAKQRQIYDANLQQLLDSLRGQSQEEFKTGKIQILAALTRLRQLCCDPALVYENYQGGAAKVDTCLELIRNAMGAGNQILVFSQFTQALERLKNLLEKEGIGYYLLTGATSKERRIEMVNAFNQDKTPVFLISLKAGGTGLNLTAASIVIHFDPWWNMAAQNQATDRAHRIGQKQVVTVYKLIVKNTLEEKILKLQEQKAQLTDEIISDGSIRDVLATREEFMEILGE